MASEKASVLGVIPARLASTRLPRKMLAPVGGVPLVVMTARAALSSGAFDRVVIAADDDSIVSAAKKEGFEAVLTDPTLPSGTDRIAVVAKATDYAVYVNVQGDEPLIDPVGLRRLVASFDDPLVEMATLWAPLPDQDRENPNVVKVVADARENALLFSRSLIPYPRNPGLFKPRKHIGVYGYRRGTLLRFVGLKPCELERAESLEQLRALYNGISIRMVQVENDSRGVDTQEDLERVRKVFERGRG